MCKCLYTLENQFTHTAKLAGNGIGDEGAKQLAKSLANNTTLTSLDLRGTRWGSVTPVFFMYMYAYVCVGVMQPYNRKLCLTLTLAFTLPLMLTLTLTLTASCMLTHS